MAQISVRDNTQTYRISRWLGLNESPDGDTGLKLGEAAAMRNFRITRENHLQIRPGYAAVCTPVEGKPVRGLWRGYVGGAEHLLCACGGRLWDIDQNTWRALDVGDIDDGPVSFFGFSQKVYLLTGSEYYAWDGYSPVAPVDGYAPIVATAVPPAGGGTLLERVNILTGKKRAEFSPDGEAKVFQLPETEISEVLYVDGTDIPWTEDRAAGTVTFSEVPPKGVNTVRITWRKGTGINRSLVTGMRFAETYNGEADSRVFLYGDGSNVCIYSDLDENGLPSAEYFPDLNEMAVDSQNTPITALIRHHDSLLVFKPDGAFSAQYAATTLEDGRVTAAFYCTAINREIGNEALGQVKLIQNDPCTLFGRSVYRWKSAAYGVRTERNCQRISDRVENTLGGFDLARCVVFDDEQRQEFYVCCDGAALIHNYGNDTWYYYDHFPVTAMASVAGEIYFGTPSGEVMHFSRRYRNDALADIEAYWESGSMDFGAEHLRKYSANLWVAIKPESQSRVTVTAQSNRKSDYMEKEVTYGLASFQNANFAHWAFGTNRKPQVQRVRMKVKKFTFYKLIFRSVSASATATVLGVDFQVRHTGNVK